VKDNSQDMESVGPSVKGDGPTVGRGGGRGRRPKAEGGGAREGEGVAAPRPARGEEGRREGGRRGDGEAGSDGVLPQGMVGGKYNVIGLVALSGQERPAFLTAGTRVPLTHVSLPAIPAFPNPLPRATAPSTPAAAAAHVLTSTALQDDSSSHSSICAALAVTGSSPKGGGSAAASVSTAAGEHSGAQWAAVEVMEAYQDVEAKVLYLFLPYPTEIGAVTTDESYYRLEQNVFHWECQVQYMWPCVCMSVFVCTSVCVSAAVQLYS